MVRVAVTGASGFIGRSVVSRLSDTGVSVTGLYREIQRGAPGVDAVEGALADAEALDRLVSGADVVIHAASYVGSNEREQHAVNVEGTASLLRAARAAKVQHIIYVSTAGVYGDAFPHQRDEDNAIPRPRSPLSMSRHIADQEVLDAGGTVIRPNIVVGAGDRWFVPPLLQAMIALDTWIENGGAKISLIDVDLLGAAIAALSTRPYEPGVYHAARPEPPTISEVVTPLFDAMRRTVPARSIRSTEALVLLAPQGVTPTQLAMVSADNWFDTGKLWNAIGGVPDEVPLLSAKAIHWYAREVATKV